MMHHERRLQSTLRHLTRCEVEVRLRGTDRTPLSARRMGEGGWSLTLHPCFQLAGEEVLSTLSRHLRGPSPRTAKALRAFIRTAREEIPGRPRRRPRLTPIGRHFDLRAVRDALSERYFAGEVRPAITWGKAAGSRRRRRRSMVFGTYDESLDLIRIHPELDSQKTPPVFLEYIVYHEMLHAVHPIECTAGGRRIIHTGAFKRAERRFHAYEEAMSLFRKWTEGS